MPINRRRFIKASGAALGSTALWGCGRDAGDSAQIGRPASSKTATVFHNGTVLPVDAAFSEHTAIAIRGNRIIAVGDDESVLSAAGSEAKVIDLAGRTLLPGFIEPHMHFALLAGLGHLTDIG